MKKAHNSTNKSKGMNMAKRIKCTAKKRYPDAFRYVFLELSSKDLNPDKLTKILDIQPSTSFKRGDPLKNKYGKIVKNKKGKSIKMLLGGWTLHSRVRENSKLETHIEDILKQIRPKKAVLKQILKKVDGVLTIAVEPHKDVALAWYLFSGDLLNEFTSLGIDIEFSIHIPQKWDEFRRKILKKANKK
jgi:hypothetical protein